MDVEVRSFSTLALGGHGQLHAPVRFIPGQRAAVTHCTGGWMGPTTGLDDLEKKENLLVAPEVEPRIIQPID